MEYTSNENRCLERIAHHEEMLIKADNNKKYISALKYLEYWLELFSELLHKRNVAAQSAEYEAMFYTGAGFSFYERVLNSITEYEYGVRPF